MGLFWLCCAAVLLLARDVDGLIVVSMAPWPAHNPTHSAVCSAVDTSTDHEVGSCCLEAVPMTSDGEVQSYGGRLRPLLTGLIVEPPYRRCGVGRTLMRDAERHVLSWGYGELLLHVQSRNVQAMAFYRSCGYEPALDVTPPEESFLSWLGGGSLILLRKRLRT